MEQWDYTTISKGSVLNGRFSLFLQNGIRENNHSFYERNYIDIDIMREDKIMMLALAIILVTIDVLMELETIEMNRGLTV